MSYARPWMNGKSRMAAWWSPIIAALTLTAMVVLFPSAGMSGKPGQGTLTIIEPDGQSGGGCPLEHTSVKAEVSGFVSRVTVTQVFHNPRKDKIEAVYTFPLPSDAAVDDMLMRVGDRVVRGEIKRREEARRIYEQARDRGHVASLLDQERPNIFTQSVANIMPGQKVEITIKYVEMLPFVDGACKFVFPMVVGPRFIPGEPTGTSGTGWAPDTTQVPDASKITPPVTPEGTRAGHDIDVSLSIDAGVPILGIDSKLHEVTVERDGKNRAKVAMKNKKEIPNKDFVLEYQIAGDEVKSGVLVHKDGKEGFVSVIMIPPKRVKPEQIAPKEMIFVIDCSGSQAGKPIAKAKETMRYIIDHMNPDDTFNIIDFNQGSRMLFPEPKKNTPEYREKALKYLSTLEARGGTWMGPAVETICKSPSDSNRLRIVTFMTDGYVGNDFEIISLVKKHRGKSRWFPYGTGNSINRFLIDQMAKVGGGEPEVILLNSPGEEIAKKFYKRISTPVLTDISLSTSGISLEEVFPGEVSDVWDQKPLIFKARYTKAGKGKITIKGFAAGKPYEQTLEVTLPDKQAENSSLAALWARAKVDELMDRNWMGMQKGTPEKDIKEEIIKVALQHRIMTQFTSFVAVEETVITVGGKPTKVTVPVEMPDGVSREGVFGESDRAVMSPQSMPMGVTGSVPQKRAVLGRTMNAPGSVPPSGPPAPSRGWESLKWGAYGKSRPQGPMPEGLPSQAPQEAYKDKVRSLEEEARPRTAGEPELKKDERALRDEARVDAKLAALGRKISADLLPLLEMREKVKDYTKGKVVVKDGKITLQVWLTKSSDDVIKKLKELGLEVSFQAATGKMVIGTLAVEKLKELAQIPEVRLIEPFAAKS
ncbi:MAG: VIT domain-containing protein [Thermodesulfobacteriota bacterium]